MPRTVAPTTVTSTVRNRVSHMSVATIPAIRGGPADVTACTFLGLGAGCWREQRKVLPDPRAATHNTDVSVLVGPVDADEVVDLVVGGDRLAGVAPEPVEDVVLHGPALHVPVVDVGDLQLAPAGRLQGRDHVEDVLVVEVDPGDHVVARGDRKSVV